MLLQGIVKSSFCGKLKIPMITLVICGLILLASGLLAGLISLIGWTLGWWKAKQCQEITLQSLDLASQIITDVAAHGIE